MRHNKHHASLGVTREHRAAMLSNLAASLIEHGRIQTTLTKAKALRPFIEKVITKAKKAAAATEKKDQIHLRRLARFGKNGRRLGQAAVAGQVPSVPPLHAETRRLARFVFALQMRNVRQRTGKQQAALIFEPAIDPEFFYQCG